MNTPPVRFDKATVLVVGDVMLDVYYHGDTQRISPEAPVPVVKTSWVDKCAGGAANVAINLSTLGVTTHLIGMTGNGHNSRFLEEILDECGVRHHLLKSRDNKTIVKSRVMSGGRQLLRYDSEESFAPVPKDGLNAAYEELIQQVDAVILSDYAKGCLSDITTLIAVARRRNKAVFIDPKGKAYERYRNATVLTPNYREFITVVGPCDNKNVLHDKAGDLRNALGLQALFVTLGKDGVLIAEAGQATQHLVADAQEVYDVTGAGDTMIAVLTAAHACGMALPLAARYANKAAGLVVGKSGTATVNPDELFAHTARHTTICERARLLELVKEARRRNERIVMTNGCFDIPHAGHIGYLEQAAQYGDHLIVAVNDDASVMRLKGAGRPVNTLDDRMTLLAALKSVDWIVPFSEDTPETLIKAVSPDVLVKGGDYKPSDIAGAGHVRANGGEVVVLDYLDGYSTSDLIKRIRGK